MNTKIIKRNLKIEEFNIKKIETSIINAANDIGRKLTRSDLKLLLFEIQKKLNTLHPNDSPTSVYEVRSLIYHTLLENKFDLIAKEYMNL